MLLCNLSFQIDFKSDVQNPLASVLLPATLLHNLSGADVEIISRIHFMFFSRTGLFQVSASPNPSLLYCTTGMSHASDSAQ